MTIHLETAVNQDFMSVWNGFDADLFVALAPPFPIVTLKQFDGCKTGDKVKIELNALVTTLYWNAKIIAHDITENHAQFIDVADDEAPFFIKDWKHTHTIAKAKQGSVIIDHIEYKTYNMITDLFFYPLFLLQFLYRKPIYKRYFK